MKSDKLGNKYKLTPSVAKLRMYALTESMYTRYNIHSPRAVGIYFQVKLYVAVQTRV